MQTDRKTALPPLSFSLPTGSDSPTAVFSSNGDFIGNVNGNNGDDDHSGASWRNKHKWRSGNGALKLSAQSNRVSISTKSSSSSLPAGVSNPSPSPRHSPRRSPRHSGGGGDSVASSFGSIFSFGRTNSSNSSHSPAKVRKTPNKSPRRSPSSRRLSSNGSTKKRQQLQRPSGSWSTRYNAAPVRCDSKPEGIEMADLSGISAAKKMKLLLQADEEENW